MTPLTTWAIFAGAIVLGTTTRPGTRTPADAANERAKLARTLGLPLTDELAPRVLHRNDERKLTASMWGWSALVAGLIAAAVASSLGHGELGPLLILGLTVVGLSAGNVIGALRSKASLDDDAPRVARATATTADDYTTKGERVAVLLAAFGIVVSIAAAIAVWAFLPLRPVGVAMPMTIAAVGVAAVAVILVLRWLVGRVVERPQHANSDLELAWDDAARALAARELQELAIGIGLATTLHMLVTAGTWVIEPEVRAAGMETTLALGSTALAVGAVCWFAVFVPWVSGRRDKNPSAKLWAGHRFEESAC